MLKFFVSILLIVPIAGFSALTSEKARDKMIQDLDIIKNTFEIKYAPAEWKKIYADWELDIEIEKAKLKVIETPNITLKDYQRILLNFFNSTKDYHTGVSFYSTEMALLPFRIHSAQGNYYVASVMNGFFFERDHVRQGDEVILFNSKPIGQVVEEFKKQNFGSPLSPTDHALAESMLTMRTGASGYIVPKGPATITVKRKGVRMPITFHMEWFYLSEEIPSPISPFTAAVNKNLLHTDGTHYYMTKSLFKDSLNRHPFFHKDMSTPIYKRYKKAMSQRNQILEYYLTENSEKDIDDEDSFIGAETSFIPPLGHILWKTNNFDLFNAYIYLDNLGRKIGYIRIPHFMGGAFCSGRFAEIINLFEEETDALVIDQVNNPGGSMFYMYALAAMLTDKPLLVPKERITITQEDVSFALDHLNTFSGIEDESDAISLMDESLDGYHVDLDFARGVEDYMRFIINEWKEGRILTNSVYLYGIDYIKPHPAGHYSKPVLFLVNQLDFSCADFLPAILQDNKRAVILGTRTAGAGGYVLSHAYPNLFGIEQFTFTASIAQRVDRNPIENLGVAPDILVELTQKDLEKNYVDYTAHIHQAVSDLLK